MNIQELLDRLQARNVALGADKGELVLNGPRGALNAELIALIRENKLALLEELAKRGTKAEAATAPKRSMSFRITPDLLPLIKLTQPEIDGIVAAIPGGAANIQDIYPLAPLQEGILFHHLIDKEGDPYLLSSPFAFASRQRLDDFIGALQVVIDRHDILRTAIFWEALSKPVQVVYRQAPLTVIEAPAEDDEPGSDAAGRLRAATDPRRLRLDLGQAPLMRAYICHDPDQGEWLLFLLNHHMISDHVGLEIIAREIALVLEGQEALLPKPIPYRDFVARNQAIDPSVHEHYFRGLLGDVDEPTAPFGIMDTHGDGKRIAESRLALDDVLAARLRACAALLKMTPAALFHVAWAQVLAKCGARDDVVFGTVLSGRLQDGDNAGQAMGLFINTLPVRARLAGRTASQAVAEMHAQLSGLLAHEQASLMLAQRCSRVPALTPLFTAIFNYRYSRAGNGKSPSPAPTSVWQGVRILESEERSNYPLGISVDDLDLGFALTVQCADGIDAAAIAAQLVTALASLAEALECGSPMEVVRLDTLPATELARVLHSFNDTATSFPSGKPVHQLFEEQAARTPGGSAVVFGSRSLSYGELNARANRLAHRLISMDVAPEARVAICLERSIGMVVGLLAILKAGASYVPLDPAYPAERLAHMLDDAAPMALITQGAVAQSLPVRDVPVIVLDAGDVDAVSATSAYPSSNPVVPALAPSNLAYVIYTSGSTGRPKGVMVTHRGLSNLALAQIDCFGIRPDSRLLQFASFSFDASVSEIMTALCAGAALHLASRADLLPGEPLRQTLADNKITHVTLPASALAAWPDENVLPPLTLVLAGEALPAPLARRWSRRHRVINAYGPTESTVCASAYLCTGEETGSVPIGRPIANMRVYILDARQQPVPVGVTGEIVIGGVGVARGYLNRPELTAERFLGDPFCGNPEATMYRTGDLARWQADGNIDYQGRNDFQVKLRGFRIEPGEIEAALLDCKGVREAAVVAREDLPGDKRLVAYVTAQAGTTLAPAALRETLSATLADYMVPSAFVVLDALPLTPNGKLDRKALPAPDAAAVIARAYEAPQGEIEQAIAAAWQELLGIERVGRHDHFFELGGHSLMAVRLASHLRRALGIELPLRQLFAHPVLADLAFVTMHASRSEAPPILPVDRSANMPLSWMQQRLWFLNELDTAAGAAYHMPGALRLRGPLSLHALQAALDHMVARHESLRTTFVRHEGHPILAIARSSPFVLEQRDMSCLPAAAGEAALEQAVASFVRIPFDLSSGPLIRGLLVQVGQNEHVLAISQHHIISDGWSIGIFSRELAALYDAFRQGLPDPLPPLPIQYADFAAWQRNWLQGEVLASQVAFWRDHLQGAPALLELPADRTRPAVQDYAGATVPVLLPPSLSRRLREFSREHDATLFMTLMAGWAILLSRLSGRDDIVIGTPVANRQRSEVEPLIGFFVNTLALRTTLAEHVTVKELLAQVKNKLLSAYAHQDLPFEQVVEAVQPVRGLGHSPIFQAMLSLNNNPANDLVVPDLTLSPHPLPHATTHFDLSLSLTEDGDAIIGSLDYATGLFDASTIERWAGHLATLLAAMTDQASDTGRLEVASLPLLTDDERRHILAGFNDRPAYANAERLIHHVFEEQAHATPDAQAVVFQDHALTYGELNRRANQLAHHLLALGVAPEDRVAICVERSVEMVVGLMAILKAGAAYVPLDPDYPAQRLLHMLNDSKPSALLTQRSLVDDLPGGGIPLIVLDGVNDLAEIGTRADTDPALPGLTARNLAYMIYTSGSTGASKGVMVEHRSAVNFWRVMQNTTHRLCPKPGRIALNASYSFDMSLKGLLQLLSGHCLFLIPQLVRADGTALLAFLERHAIDAFDCTPTQLDLLLSAGLIDENGAYQPKCVLIGGEAINPLQWRKLRSAKTINFYNMYGPTEATVDATLGALKELGERPNIGKPVAGARIYLLDARRQAVPVGVAGEIHIGGIGVARGYFGRPELTRERFIPDPFEAQAGSRLYKTGDLARWRPDGSLEYLGRNDFQVKIRGFRIELGEIEAQLLDCDGVREAVVVAREDAPGERRLVAYVVAHAGRPVDAAALRSQLASALAEYMVPGAFVFLPALPVSPNGKLERKMLPAPDQSAIVTRRYEAPQGEAEKAVADVWQGLMGLGQVGRHDHFFELGGHSLLIVAMVEKLRARAWHLDVRAVFATPVLSDVAAQLIRRDGKNEPAAVPPNLIPENCSAITPAMLPLVQLSPAEVGMVVEAAGESADCIQDIYPLSPLQEGILFHHMLNAGNDVYLQQATMRFDSRAHLDRFLHALQGVMDRHDILRTGFHWEGLAKPVQRVMRRAVLPVHEAHLEGASDPVAQLQAVAQRAGMDLRKAPLMAAHIGAIGSNTPGSAQWLLCLQFHHITVDHIALDIIVEEILAQLQGKAGSLPAPVPYRNFIALLPAVSRDEHEAYFRARLGDIEEPTAPFGVLEVHGHGGTTEETRTILDAGLSETIRVKAKEHGVSAAVLFHTGFAIMLSRLVGRSDVVFGTVLLGRLQGVEGADKALGLFMNTLPLRLSLAEGDVEDAVRSTYRHLQELIAHEQAPLALAQRCSGVAPLVPLFSALFNYRHSGAGNDRVRENWEGMQLLHVLERTNYPLTLSVDDLGQDFSLSALCTPGISGVRINAYMESAMAALVDALGKNVAPAALDVLPADERHQVLEGFNATALAYPAGQLIHQLFEASAEDDPGAIAVVFRDESITYGDLNRRANQLAAHLLDLGIAPDDRVAVCVERSIGMIVALLAILKAGAAYVPLDPGYPAERLAYMLQDCSPAALITQKSLSGRLPSHDVTPVFIDDGARLAALAQLDASNPAIPTLSAARLAYVIYTSGSTGHPKGVMIEHGNALNFIRWALEAFTPAVLARSVFSTSINFDLAVFELFAPLAAGTTIVLVNNILSSSAELAGSTLINTVPSALSALLDDGAVPASVRMVNVAGEPLKQALAERLFAQTGVERLANLYGPTETTTYSTWVEMDRDTGFNPTIGRPVANTQIYILDSQGGPVAQGVPGEIHIAGAGVARGYLNRSELTGERFLADPFSAKPEARMYKTGDLGRWRTDGSIDYLGRNDFQIKIRGFRIELGEIESRLAAIAGVKEAVVLAREDVPGDKRLVAYLVPQAGAVLSPAALRAVLAAFLAEHMIPSAFVELDALPLTPNGKLDRKALPAPGHASLAAQAYESAQGEIETAIATIWQDLLRIDRVGRHDNFFALGGHSLLVVQLAERMRRMQPPLTIPLAKLIKNPTVAGIAASAAFMSGNTAGSPGTLPGIASPRPDAANGKAPPLPNNYWFFQRLSLNHWNSSALLEVSNDLAPETIRLAIAGLLDHHDALRAVWRQYDGQWRMLIQEPPAMAPWWQRENLVHVGDADIRDEVERRCAALQTTLDIGNILFRAVYFDLGKDRPARLMLVIHHLIIDGYSKAILIQDLERSCADLQQGRTPLLPPRTTSIKELAESIQRHAESLDTKSELGFWQSRAWQRYRALPREADPQTLAPDTGMSRHGVAFAELSAVHTRQLESIPARLPGIHLEHILIAAVVKAYGKWSGSTALSLLTTHHGRSWGHDDIDLTRTVGWTGNFVNCMHDIAGCPSAREVLHAIKHQRDELLGKESHYSLLKYMHPDASVRAAMAALPGHQLEFNFIPRHAAVGDIPERSLQDAPPPSLFAAAQESAGSDDGEMHAGFTPFSKFHFDGEQLKLYWVYCQTRHGADTFGRFAAGCMHALEEIIEELEVENEIGSV